MNQSKKILIVSIYNTKGGPLVINFLCHLLNKAGYDAKIYLCKYAVTSKSYSPIKFFFDHLGVTLKYLIGSKIPFLTKEFPNFFYRVKHFPNLKFKIFPVFNKKNTIVIYPEIFYGNPLKAINVVRWLLFFNRYPNDVDAYSSDDLFIAFRKIFNDHELNPQELIVKFNYFDSLLYRQYNHKERKGNCYIIRKGHNREDLPTKFDGPVFDNNMTDEEFVKILNKCKYCYSYDTQTFYTSIAAICGCIPIVVMEKGKSKSDYLLKDEDSYGIAYGDSDEEIEYAINTRPQLIKSLDFEDSNNKNLNCLISILQEKFGSLSKKKRK